MKNPLKEAIIDTDFLNKVTQAPNVPDGKDLFMRTMKELGVTPVVHCYVAEREMKVCNRTAEKLIEEGVIKVYKIEDFIQDDDDKTLYDEYFRKWYDYLNLSCPLEKDVDIFKLQRAKCSLGEIHSVLMAYFLKLNMIMSDDSDAKELVSYSGIRNLKVFDLVDVYSYIGRKERKCITLEEAECVIRSENSKDSHELKKIKKKRYQKVKAVWINTYVDHLE